MIQSMLYKKWNTRLGWFLGLTASLVYLLTAEAAGSFWDCGEFISCAYRIQNAHPPGNVVFVLVGRLFVILFGDNPDNAAYAVNAMSAVSGGVTIMFLFWIMTHFARKLVQRLYDKKVPLSVQHILIFLAAGIGALSAVFVDSFWFSTVEGEVYALAACVLVAMVWLMTKWENRADEPGADNFLILIFLLIGLSLGVHLLDLLVLPVLVMMYYFKRFANNITTRGILLAFAIGCAVTGLAMWLVISKTITWGAAWDVFFVNTLQWPVFSGFLSLLAVLLAVALLCIWYAHKKSYYFLKLGAICYLMLLLGYSTYNVSVIRAEAKVPINMTNPDNPMGLLSYVSRAQYGDKPLIFGQVFTAGNAVGKSSEEYQPKYKEGTSVYSKITLPDGKAQYVVSDKEGSEEFHPSDMMLFPRVWNNRHDGRGTQDFYANWLGINKVQDEKGRALYERSPTFGDNLRWFLSYQIGWMYLRYLMWNFVGRQNDIQGLGNVRDGNVITGISFVDNWFLGDQSKMPATIKNHPSRNTLFALPFILGIIGLVFHAKKDAYHFITVLVFFFFTGLAIMLYLNDAGPQPRERDYASAVSFLVFCLWIGFSVIAFFDMLYKKVKMPLITLLLLISAGSFAAAPLLMATQEWDDHDRSKKVLARDFAKNILNSCDSNAVLFTSADNDTYPLWYVQEVEGCRRDVRVVNTSLLGIDWYINQLVYKENEGAPIDLIFKPEQLVGSRRNYVLIHKLPIYKDNDFLDLEEVLRKFVASENTKNQLALMDGSYVSYFPTYNYMVQVDTAAVRRNGCLPEGSRLLPQLPIMLPKEKRGIRKDELAILSVIAATHLSRPIHFMNMYNDLGFGHFLQRQGMTYKLVPLSLDEKTAVNVEKSLPLLLETYCSGGLETAPVYVDETNRMQVLSIRETYADVANTLVDMGLLDKARAVLKRGDELFPQQHLPYGLVSRYNMHNTASLRYLEAAYRAKDSLLYQKIAPGVQRDLEEQILYYNTLPPLKGSYFAYELQRAQQLLDFLKKMKTTKEGAE